MHFTKLHPSEQVTSKRYFQADASCLINDKHLSGYKMCLKGNTKVYKPEYLALCSEITAHVPGKL